MENFSLKRKAVPLHALNEELKDYINLESFIQHFKDIIDYRTVTYYKTRFEKEGVK